MGGNAGSMVDCPICGEEFDPKGAGGWCTNPECGEWQYDGEEASEGSTGDTAADDPPGADAGDGDGDSDGDGDGRTFPQGWAQPDVGGVDDAAATPDADGTDEPDGDPSRVAASGATAGDTPEEDGSDEPSEMSEDTDETDPSDASVESDGATTGDLVELEVEDPDGGQPEAVDAGDSGRAGAVTDEAPVVAGGEQESEPELSACPSCGADVDPGDNFCVSCGEALLPHQDEEVLQECPSCDADVDPDDSFCVSCGEDLDAHRGGDGVGTAPQSLLLSTRGEEIAVTDGDTVGRELRRILMTTGGDEDQAVRIHREHVRFVRENGQFYVIDLGKNPTRLNGHPLEKGDREPVSPGDEIELSGVLGLVIREP